MRHAHIFLAVMAPLLLTGAGEGNKTYRWVDDNGVVHFGDSVPPEFAEKDKIVVNNQGIHVDFVKGKITEAELAEIARQKEIEAEKERERRRNQALLATYLSVEEIEMHRDRRIELVKAQSKVANLYLSNLKTRMTNLQSEAGAYRPYSNDPDAPPVPLDLAEDMEETKGRIERYRALRDDNLDQEKTIIERFETDIARFRRLKSDQS